MQRLFEALDGEPIVDNGPADGPPIDGDITVLSNRDVRLSQAGAVVAKLPGASISKLS